ncbi:hypothetical protein H5T87_10935 [bacterium]|nr:hypothetical protein [bacterium]
MKKITAIFFLLFALTPFVWGMISMDEAMPKVRQFEGIPDLQLIYVGLDHELTAEEVCSDVEKAQLPWPCYFIKTTSTPTSPLRCYKVDPYTGEVTYWSDADNEEPIYNRERQASSYTSF